MAYRSPLFPFGFASLLSWEFCSSFILLLMLLRMGEGMTASAAAACLPNQRLALLQFKQGLSPTWWTAQKLLSTWQNGSDCCKWEGISCGLTTGFVTKLDLSYFLHLRASEVHPSLFQLRHLRYLDFSSISFGGIIPSRLSELTDLTDLRLYHCNFIGPIPESLKQLPNLTNLDLSLNDLSGEIPPGLLNHPTLQYLHLYWNSLNGSLPDFGNGFSQLREISLSDNMLDGEIPSSISNLPHLELLDLQNNKLSGTIDLALFQNLKNLSSLILSNNELTVELPKAVDRDQQPATFSSLKSLALHNCNIKGGFPQFLQNAKGLEILSLKGNNISGNLPSWVWDLLNLQFLDLSYNKLNGSLPDFGNGFSTLRYIYLSHNMLDGQIPSSLSNLFHLKGLDLNGNGFSGTIHLSLFQNLRNLTILSLSNNKLTVKLPKVVDPNQQVEIFSRMNSLELRSCNIEGELPSGKIPTHVWGLQTLNMRTFGSNGSNDSTLLRRNYTREPIPVLPICNMFELYQLDLSGNNLTGTIPDCITNLTSLDLLDLSNNQFHGQIPKALICRLQTLELLALNNNQLTGEATTFPYNCSSHLTILDLSHNRLMGRLPDNWLTSFHWLEVLDLSSNQLHGPIPNQLNVSIARILRVLNLNDNKLVGRIPSSLSNFNQLEIINLGKNKLSDVFPSWINHLNKLRVLVLDSNKLYGSIQSAFSNHRFSSLQILSISGNQLTGQIPSMFFQNSSFMMGNQSNVWLQMIFIPLNFEEYDDALSLNFKGHVQLWTKSLPILTSIDLSDNQFVGPIPDEMGALEGLCSLNLSWNKLNGSISRSLGHLHRLESLGHLHRLESLDLSHNHLSGSIPEELTRDTFLSVLDLSYNNLQGRIPQANQFHTFNITSFEGNPMLCGPPLTFSCPNSDIGTEGSISDVEETSTRDPHWEYLAASVGFAMGFLTITFPVLSIESVRSWYWDSVDGAMRF